MVFKSVTFTLEITLGSFEEKLHTKDVVAEFLTALESETASFAKNISNGSDGAIIGNAKVVGYSEDWQ